jgi:putative flippase GtrA
MGRDIRNQEPAEWFIIRPRMLVTKTSRRIGTPIVRQFAKYGLVGVTNSLIGFAIYAACVKLGVQYLVASALAYAVGSLNGYVLNRRWTFRAGHISHATSASRYGAVQLSALLGNLGLLYVCVEVIGVEKILAQAIVVVVVFVATFVANRVWSFAHHGEDLAAQPTAS